MNKIKARKYVFAILLICVLLYMFAFPTLFAVDSKANEERIVFQSDGGETESAISNTALVAGYMSKKKNKNDTQKTLATYNLGVTIEQLSKDKYFNKWQVAVKFSISPSTLNRPDIYRIKAFNFAFEITAPSIISVDSYIEQTSMQNEGIYQKDNNFSSSYIEGDFYNDKLEDDKNYSATMVATFYCGVYADFEVKAFLRACRINGKVFAPNLELNDREEGHVILDYKWNSSLNAGEYKGSYFRNEAADSAYVKKYFLNL